MKIKPQKNSSPFKTAIKAGPKTLPPGAGTLDVSGDEKGSEP